MKIECIWEHNGGDSLLYAGNCMGAFTRGASLEEAVRKMPDEIRSYYAWLGEAALGDIECDVVQEKDSQLEIKDADRWQDIAIVLRSLEHNFSGRYNGGKAYFKFEPYMLFDELGLEMDAGKNRYYMLLDELF